MIHPVCNKRWYCSLGNRFLLTNRPTSPEAEGAMLNANRDYAYMQSLALSTLPINSPSSSDPDEFAFNP